MLFKIELIFQKSIKPITKNLLEKGFLFVLKNKILWNAYGSILDTLFAISDIKFQHSAVLSDFRNPDAVYWNKS